jgi:hypothetical protein
MKRDMELVRKLLFHLEARSSMKAQLTFPVEATMMSLFGTTSCCLRRQNLSTLNQN